MNRQLICGLATGFLATLLSGCGDVESSQHREYRPTFSILSTQIMDTPVKNGRLTFAAGKEPARFSVSWNLSESGPNSSYTANLYLSRDKLVDHSDKQVSTIQCDNYDTNGCGYSATFQCDYTSADAIHCLDNSRRYAPDLSDYLRKTGEWPWQGHLILEFCQSGSQECVYSHAFPVSLDKSTENNTADLTRSTMQISGTALRPDNQTVAPPIFINGASAGDKIITVEPDTEYNRFNIFWNPNVDHLSDSMNMVLSRDAEYSYDDQTIFNDFLNYKGQDSLNCRLTPMNEFVCGTNRSAELSEYFTNSGGMPWKGYLLVHFMPAHHQASTMKYVVPMKLQY